MNNIDKRKEQLNQEKENWEKQKQIIIEEKKLKEDKINTKKKKISTTKLIMLFLFINCSLIQIFTGFITLGSFELARYTGTGMVDFSPMVTLIGAVVGQVIGFAVYSIKASRENTVGGIVYETTMKELQSGSHYSHGEDDQQDDEDEDDIKG